MRAVFSAIWRSLASAAITLASPRRGARRISRAVSRTGIQLSRKVSDGTCSSPVMAGSLASNVAVKALRKAPRGSRHPVSPSWNLKVPAGSDWNAGGTSYVSSGLLGRSLRHRNDRDEGAVFGFRTVLDASVDQRKQRMVHTYADVLARMPLRAALTHENIAGKAALAAKQLHAKALARRVAAVSRRSACFLVCHGWNLSSGTT